MSDLDEMASGLRDSVAQAAWPEPAAIRAHGDRRTARRRAAAATGAAVLTLSVVAAVAFGPRLTGQADQAPATDPPSRSPHPTVTALPPVARPVIVARTMLAHDFDVGAVAVANGSVWIALTARPDRPGPPAAGELVRLDAATLQVKARWAVLGAPTAVAATNKYVWVAGNDVDGASPVRDPHEVQQFSLDGRLLHTYPVFNPQALAADGDSVWVSNIGVDARSYLRRLHDGVAEPIVSLMGSQGGGTLPLVVCKDGVYVASVDSDAHATHVQRLQPPAALVADVAVAGTGLDTLVCRDPGLVLALGVNASLYRLPFDGSGAGAPAMTLPAFSNPLAGSGDLIWLGKIGSRRNTTEIWTVDLGSMAGGESVTVQSEVVLGAAEASRLWTVGFDTQQPGQWIITVLATS